MVAHTSVNRKQPVRRQLLKMSNGISSFGFPSSSPRLEKFGFKFSFGGAHISRTMATRWTAPASRSTESTYKYIQMHRDRSTTRENRVISEAEMPSKFGEFALPFPSESVRRHMSVSTGHVKKSDLHRR